MTDERQRQAPVELTLGSRRFVRTLIGLCVGAELAFVFLDYHVNFGRLTDIGMLRRFNNIAREDSLASWFGNTQTLLIACTLWLIYLGVRRQDVAPWRKKGWLVLALFFSFMAFDDGVQLHETVGTVVDHFSDLSFPSYAWQFVMLPFFVAVGFFSLVFLWCVLERRSARLLVLAALCGFGMAAGLDFVEGLDRNHPWNIVARLSETIEFGDYTEYRFRENAYDTLQHFAKSIEEFLEMLANTILWYVFLGYLPEVASEFRVRFQKGTD
jgi:hypothetical protein